MDEYLRIGDLAKRAGITVKAVRHYEAKGLLPVAGRTDSGYRYFRREELALLRVIAGLRRIGFSLREIREVVVLIRQACCPEVRPWLRNAIDAKLRETELRVEELLRLRALLSRYRDRVAKRGVPATEECATAACTCVEDDDGRVFVPVG